MRTRPLRTMALVAVLAGLGCGDDGASSPAAGFFDGPVPRNIAHRGGADRAPENTLVGFGSGLALGAQILECDVQATSDGEVVMIHDLTVDRTTDGTGAVKRMTLEEIKRLDAGYDFGRDGEHPYRGQGITIPTLDEAFAAFPRERFLIELKQGDPPIEQAVLDVIERHDMHGRVCLASFNGAVVQRIRDLDPTMCTTAGLPEVVRLTTGDVDELLAEGIEATSVQFPWDLEGIPLVGPRLVERYDRLGVELHVWTVDDRDDMRTLLELGVAGIITDRPDDLAEEIEAFAGTGS